MKGCYLFMFDGEFMLRVAFLTLCLAQGCDVRHRAQSMSWWHPLLKGVHFPTIFRHVEAAEHACLKALGLLVFDRGQGGWPRVSVSCDFRKPLVAGDPIEVQLAVERIGRTSVSWLFEVLNADGQVAAQGGMTNVRVNATGKPQELSPAEREALGSHGG